jgi:hypothetical protein
MLLKNMFKNDQKLKQKLKNKNKKKIFFMLKYFENSKKNFFLQTFLHLMAFFYTCFCTKKKSKIKKKYFKN